MENNKNRSATYYQSCWDEEDKFEYNGLTFRKGVNDATAKEVLRQLHEKEKIQTIEINPEVQQLRPFIRPEKGFSIDEVMTLIQKVINSAVDQLESENASLKMVNEEGNEIIIALTKERDELKAENERLKQDKISDLLSKLPVDDVSKLQSQVGLLREALSEVLESITPPGVPNLEWCSKKIKEALSKTEPKP